jgi:phage tail sheath protein FI
VPEYLTPGVYVEETSFRSKSIEGVSTSTTAFVGPTRRGPAVDDNNARELEKYDTPELVTSFGEFQRVYGGLEPMDWAGGRPNYLAHAVSAYFENGGARLYVVRVVSGKAEEGRSHSAWIVGNADPATEKRARFVARFPGKAGDGTILVRAAAVKASKKSLETAPPGSLLRLGGDSPAQPAVLVGGAPPFRLENDSVLVLKVKGTTHTIRFHGQSTEVAGDTPLPDTLDLDATNNTVRITLDGREQVITLPEAPTARGRIVDLINSGLRGGYARLADDNTLVVGSDRQGTRAAVTVNAPGLEFPPGGKTGTPSAANTVGDLDDVQAEDIETAMKAVATAAGLADFPATAILASGGKLTISTRETGEAATIEVLPATGNDKSAHAALGLQTGQPAKGVAGTEIRYYIGSGTTWTDAASAALDSAVVGNPESKKAELVTLTVIAMDRDGDERVYEGLGLDKTHPRWIGSVLKEAPLRRIDALQNMFALSISEKVGALDLLTGLLPGVNERTWTLTGGSDGNEPGQDVYKRALDILHRIDDVSIVAAPGAGSESDTAAQAIHNALISHVETQRTYRIAVLDTPRDKSIGEAQTVRSRIDSKKAALYYPWIVIPNPLARPDDQTIPPEIAVPPSGAVCGIYARTDVQRGVHKPPANEVVLGALRFETDINFAEQGALNPMGVNCFRFFPGRGYRLWGARTVSSDPEWKYVNVRRYFNYVEHSIDRGTQWAVFEPNGERLWANIRETVSSFLYNEWFSGALLGANTKEAYFVRCDRSTMTQNDLDNGRLVCLIGIAALKPAEFVIFRIGQKTADARG